MARSIAKGGMEGNGGKKEAERERAELQQGTLGLLRSAACPIEHVTIAFWAMTWHKTWLALGEQARVFCDSAGPGPSGREVKSRRWKI